MKKLFLPIIAVLFLASCSSPKYTYHFSTHKQYAQKDASKQELTQAITEAQVSAVEVEATAPQEVETLTANAAPATPAVVEANPLNAKAKLLKEKYENANFSDKNVMREVKADVKELKKDVKKYMKENKKKDSVSGTSALDKNLKLAIIFAIAAAIASIFIWQVGAVLWIIALVFLILWVMEQ